MAPTEIFRGGAIRNVLTNCNFCIAEVILNSPLNEFGCGAANLPGGQA